MKRIAILLTALLLLTACGKTSAPPVLTNDTLPSGASPIDTPPTPETINLDQYDDYLLYPVAGRSFTVDDDGNLYLYEIKTDENKNILEKGIIVYDLNGNETAKYSIDSSPQAMCVGDGKLYFTSFTDYPAQALYSVDLKTQELNHLAPLDRYTLSEPNVSQMKIAYLDGSVYILAVDPDYTNIVPELWDGDSLEQLAYDYYGTVLIRYDIAAGTFEIVFDNILHSFTVTPDKKIMVFAHDSIGGFYFQTVDPYSGFALGDKMYQRIYQMGDFATDGKGVMYTEQHSFSYWNYKDDISGLIAETDGTTPGSDHIIYVNGFTFISRFVTDRGSLQNSVQDSGKMVPLIERYKTQRI